MRLWQLQAAIIALVFLLGWGVAHFPSKRNTPKLKEMCATVRPGDPVGVQLCADLKRS